MAVTPRGGLAARLGVADERKRGRQGGGGMAPHSSNRTPAVECRISNIEIRMNPKI